MAIGFRKTNHFAVIGFLLPFMAAALACLFVLLGKGADGALPLGVTFLAVIPLVLLIGLLFSVKSIPLIKDLGDKDYAYSGLVLNIFFIMVYIYSLFHCIFVLS